MNIFKLIRNHKVLDYLMHMVIFAAAFTIIGFYAPKIYLHNFDKTEYYKVVLPVKIEHKTYYPGDYVDIYFERTALIPIRGQSTIVLTLVNDKGVRERMSYEVREVIADVGTAPVIAHWVLPMTISHYGVYFFDGVLTYPIDGTTRSYHFYTEKFNIIPPLPTPTPLLVQ